MDTTKEKITVELVPTVNVISCNDSDLDILDEAAACCIAGKTYSKFEDRLNRIKRLIHMEHTSVLEHLVFTFEIECSRAALQQIARHRIASLSVQSTRYTLQKGNYKFYKVAPKEIPEGLTNDVLKYHLPESLMTKFIWTINLRSLRNFVKLRSSAHALEELQIICILLKEGLKDMGWGHLVELIEEPPV